MEGPLFSLILIYLTLVSATQYLQWRMTHTLVYRSHHELILSLGLCTLEMCVALYMLARSVQHLWPLAIELPQAHPDEKGARLTLVHEIGDLDEAQALEALHLAGQQHESDAPHEWLVLDSRERPLLRTAASLAGARYLDAQALGAQDGDGAVLRQLGQMATSDWLVFHRSSAQRGLRAAFVSRLAQILQDKTAALLYTPDHPIALARLKAGKQAGPSSPALRKALDAQSLRVVEHPDLPALFAVERLALQEALARDPDTGLRFVRILRHRSAMLCAHADTDSDRDHAPSLLRIDRADAAVLMRLKHGTQALVRMLAMYRAPASLVVLLLPVAALLADLQVVQMRGEWLSVMALPCIVLLSCLNQRIGTRRRWGLFKALREVLLSLHITMRTAWCFVHESLHHAARALRRSFVPQAAFNPAPGSFTRYLLIALNALAFLKGLQMVLQVLALDALAFQPGRLTLMVLFMLLALRNALTLLATQALVHESGHIHAFLETSVRQTVTLLTPQGRTLRCRTHNFPALPLKLALADGGSTAPDQAGQEWQRACLRGIDPARRGHFQMQIEVAGQTHHLQVLPQACTGPGLQLDVDSASLPLWQSLQGAVLARDAHWPAWLAPENADRILPRWLSDWLNQLPARTIDLMTRIPGWLLISTWVALIKNKH